MSPILGFTFLSLVILASFSFAFFAFFAPKNHWNQQFSTPIAALIFALALAAQACLIYSFAVSNYSVLNVYQNSHHLKPMIYKISGSWGNHEGSMLLLITILSCYSFIFALTNKSIYKLQALAVQFFVIGAFAMFTAFSSNPFEIISPAPIAGLGLNPLLQDIGLSIHPPMLYIGYIGFFITFALAISGLLQEKVDKNLASQIQPWLFFSWGFLTIGIGLGSWWAYRELGWGGYWFWDPVENVSLMPWLASTALIHCVKVLQKNGTFQIWTILLSIITFILCLIGIFLVRSGLLTSVHSFAVDAGRGFFIIALISVIGGLALFLFALKAHKIKISEQKAHGFMSKTTMILLNNYFLMIALFTMLLGIFYPIFAREFFSNSISIGAGYYNKIFAILLVGLLTFLILSYFTGKVKINKPKIYLFTGISLILSIIFTFNAENATFLEITILFLTFVSAFLAGFSKKNAANIAHLGFATLLLGIILNSYLGTTKEINIKQGEETLISQNSSTKIKFEKVDYFAGKNFLARQAILVVKKGDREIATLKPQLRYYPVADQTTFEAAIRHTFFGDLYLAIGNKDEQENYALRIYNKPFIYLIWVGCLMIFTAMILKFIKIFKIRINFCQ